MSEVGYLEMKENSREEKGLATEPKWILNSVAAEAWFHRRQEKVSEAKLSHV